MASDTKTIVRLSDAATFPERFFLENLAARHDNSLLVTVANRNELYYVPAGARGVASEPKLLHRFGEMAMGIVESRPDVFLVLTTNGYTTHECYLHLLDLNSWASGQAVEPKLILTFPKEAKATNGCCLVSPNVLLVADCFAGLIWRVDLDDDLGGASASIWLQHSSMAYVDARLPPPPQPGINGIRYSAKLGYVYYTTTGQKLFMRVAVDPQSVVPVGNPERIAAGGMYDDLCLDETRGVAIVTVHRENRLDLLPLTPHGVMPMSLVGAPFDDRLIGPSSAVWSRVASEEGRVLFVTTDGGTTAPPEPTGVVNAKVVRVELA